MDVTTQKTYALVATRWAQYSPVWSPDGNWLAYVSNKIDPDFYKKYGTYNPHIYLTHPTKTCAEDDTNWLKNDCSRLLPSATVDTELDPAWLLDGSRLVYGSVITDNTDLYMIDISAPLGTPATQLTANPADDRFPG